MKVEISKHSGFCFGVKRAVDMALEEAQKGNSHVYTLGPIIHNSFVVDDLKSKGVFVVEDVVDAKDGVLVIRSHGVGRSVYSQAEQICLGLGCISVKDYKRDEIVTRAEFAKMIADLCILRYNIVESLYLSIDWFLSLV